MPDRGLVDRKGKPFQFRPRRVHHHEPRSPAQTEQQPAERFGQGAARRVAVPGGPQEIGGVFRFRKSLGQLLVEVEDRAVQNPAEGRKADVFVPGFVAEWVRGARPVQQPGVADLLEVVIVALDPEDRDHGSVSLRLQFAGSGNRGHCLDERIERTAEQSGLLAGNDRQSLGAAEALHRREGYRIGSPRTVGAGDRPGGSHPNAPGGWKRAGPRVGPRRERIREEIGKAFGVAGPGVEETARTNGQRAQRAGGLVQGGRVAAPVRSLCRGSRGVHGVTNPIRRQGNIRNTASPIMASLEMAPQWRLSLLSARLSPSTKY